MGGHPMNGFTLLCALILVVIAYVAIVAVRDGRL